MNMRKSVIRIVVIGAILNSQMVLAEHFNGHVNVTVGALSPAAKQGQQAYDKSCASCHGNNGEGTLEGPPLIHDIYNPGHHSSRAFYSAVRNGVKSHHWPYGDMPPQSDVGFSDITAIVKFIREVQQQNGIVRREHKM
ncbi:cytochrome c [uncultured Amphritea sp.]|uniref:c-type cytochrome n=1 Tax=uncultured Amphritea sp. TaxID=981605 RepID=UPI0025FC3234|nr:cytochrome c [uncultured Amphritea sp.]